MLTRLEVNGFKSFEGLKIDLAPFTAIVGNNAAGKSNLFDVIQLLSALATRTVVEAVKDLRGEPMELFRLTAGGRRVTRIEVAVEVLLDPVGQDPWGSPVELTHTRMRYEVVLERRQLRPGIERIQVAHEAARPILAKDDTWVAQMRPSTSFRRAYLKYKRQADWLSTEGKTFRMHQDGKQGRNREHPADSADATVLYGITNATEFPHLFALREELRQWRLLQLDPALLRRPTPATAADVLSSDGANLAAVLARIKAETSSEQRPQGVLSDIAAELNQLIPGISRLDAALHDANREYRIEVTMRDGLPFSSRVISDGTLRVLALLTLLHDPRHKGLICFEEPENGVHPGRVKSLVQRLRDMVSRPHDELETLPADVLPPLSQLLLNSHSPVVLSALLDRQRRPVDEEGTILFADTATITDPECNEVRRHTRLRPVRPQEGLFADLATSSGRVVSDLEVRQVLDTTRTEG